MLKEKAALFTIGQFAALHEINKKTLMWYDECSATRFLRNRDRIVEKKSPILRSISEARSLASTAPPQQGERPTQEGGLF